jgi:pimeloyl-ACP methyl ester carboxylesterase
MSRGTLATALGALAVMAALLAACTAAITGRGAVDRSTHGSHSVPSPTTPRQSPAQFTDCTKDFNLSVLHFPPGRLAHLSVGCAVISVPLNYAKPGAQIKLVLTRIHDDAAGGTRRALLVNPGGPGASGIELAVGLAAQVSDRLLGHYDLVGFDPRGVGFSTPIKCLSDHQKDVLTAASPDVLTPAGFARAKQLAASFAHACSAKYPTTLPYFNTVEAARDMDQIRQALGAPRTDYLGFSYGTELGSVYAHLFPTHVGRMVLDGAVDPLTSGIAQATEQLRGFELAFGQFAGWCRRQPTCGVLGSPARAVEQLTQSAQTAPIPATTGPDRRDATPELVITGTFGALYARKQRPALGKALVQARGGNSAGLLALADAYERRINGHYSNLQDANTTISCNDSKPGPSDAAIRATARSWARHYPVFGLWFAPSLFSCQSWQPTRTIPPKPTAGNTPEPVLVLGNLHDPATPYRGAQDLARVMGHAELLSWNGQGHTSYLNGSKCIDNYVDDYFVSGTLPPANTTCPP